VSPRGRHVAAWSLALAACAGTVAARVLVGEGPSSETFALGPVSTHVEPRTRTVTRTRTVVVTRIVARAPRPRPATPVATTAPPTPAPARRTARRPSRPAPQRAAPRARRRAAGTQNIEGDAAPTRYGAVQVRLVLRGRRIVDIVVLHHPDDLQRSREIDADALPRLREQVLAAQSAQIDGVAGATYTSAGYQHSVQSALDLA